MSIALRATDDALLQRLIANAPPLSRRIDGRSADRTYHVRDAGPCRCGDVHEPAAFFGTDAKTSNDIDELLAAYTTDVKMFVAEFAPRRVFVHAGVVAWNDRAIVLPGKSFSGKTTLVRALLDAGATYYSDEYAVLDSRGHVHPYPQPLGIRTPDKTRQIAADANALGYPIGTTPLPIALVLLTEHRRGDAWHAEPLSRARAIFEVAQHTLPYMRSPERSLDVLSRALARAETFQGRRDDAAMAARWILARLAS